MCEAEQPKVQFSYCVEIIVVDNIFFNMINHKNFPLIFRLKSIEGWQTTEEETCWSQPLP